MRRLAPLIVLLAAFSISIPAQTPAFEIVSVKPNTSRDQNIYFERDPPDGVRWINRLVDGAITYVYDVQHFRVLGAPPWTAQVRYDIEAKAAGPITEEQRRLMMRALLEDRFKLKARLEPREQTVYVLTRVRPDGPPSSGLVQRTNCTSEPCNGAGSIFPGGGRLMLRGVTVDRLAEGPLSLLLRQVVLNESGVEGAFDVQMTWRPDTVTDPNDGRPSFFTAVEEQLGMKLTPQRRPVEMLVIERIERPTPN